MASNEDFVVDGEGSGVLTVDLEAGSFTEMETSDDSNVINLLSGCEDGAVARKTHETICLEDESFIEDPSTSESQASVAMDVLSIMAGMDKDDPSFVPECFYDAISSVKGLAIEDAMKRLFTSELCFPSQKHLKFFINAYGDTVGFNVSIGAKSQLTCQRGGLMRPYQPATKSQARVRNDHNIFHRRPNSNKCNCAFVVKHKKAMPVFVTGGYFSHTNGCLPCADQLIVMKKRCGEYTRQFRDQLRLVYMHLNSSVPMPSKDLRESLSSLMPKRAIWTSKDLWNVRLSAKRYKNSLASQESFNKDVLPSIGSIFANHRSDALDNNVDDMLDPALRISHELFQQTLRETVYNKHARFMVGVFLKKLKDANR